MRIEPPWSPPSASSISPAARAAALPFDEPPGAWLGLRGLRTVAKTSFPSMAAPSPSLTVVLPTMVAPASKSRVTAVASTSAMTPSRWREPFSIGRPATEIVSLMPARMPASGPSAAPSITERQYHAL